jgi:hypothetical protein
VIKARVAIKKARRREFTDSTTSDSPATGTSTEATLEEAATHSRVILSNEADF